MKIFPLSEGSFTVDKTKHFNPYNIELDDLQARSSGSLLVEVQPFCVVTTKDVLLFDTGLGFRDSSGKMQIHTNLEKASIDPHKVTKVLLSHLHKDHAGGVSEEGNSENLSFPNAKYYLQANELKFALSTGFPSYISEEIKILYESSQVVLLHEKKGIIDNYIHFEVTSAHSPYHQVFHIVEKEETIFFGGDDAPQLQQMKHRFVAKYDFDGRKAMELRRKWWKDGMENAWKFLFYHDISTPIFSNLPSSY